jgi:hypothetical protein
MTPKGEALQGTLAEQVMLCMAGYKGCEPMTFFEVMHAVRGFHPDTGSARVRWALQVLLGIGEVERRNSKSGETWTLCGVEHSNFIDEATREQVLRELREEKVK